MEGFIEVYLVGTYEFESMFLLIAVEGSAEFCSLGLSMGNNSKEEISLKKRQIYKVHALYL